MDDAVLEALQTSRSMSLSAELVSLVRQLLPDSCPRCGLQTTRGFCSECVAEFTRIDRPCPNCGLAGPCSACPAQAAAWHTDRVLAPFLYAPPLSRFIQSFKYARQRYLGPLLGELLAAAARRHVAADLVVPVPLHPRRLRERRFNQADELARPVAHALGSRLRPGLVSRTQATPPQAGLDRQQRWRGVRRAFSVRHRIDGMHAVIVDDVITTGATASALAEQMKLAGAASVTLIALARAVAPDDQAALKT